MSDDSRGKNEDGKLLYCSFCGKSQHEVRKLIAGPSVFICDECVELCNDIIAEEVEREVTDPIEQAIQEMSQIDYVESYSRAGVSVVRVEIDAARKDRLMASQISCRLQATANHLAVSPGGGNWYDLSSVEKA